MKIDVRDLGGHRTVVLTPDRHYRVGRDRLAMFRNTGDAASSIDWAAIDSVKAHDARIFLFRGKADDDTGSWSFAEDLDAAEVEELGYWMAWCQIPSWLEMMRHGVVSFLHVEWGIREVLALERGRERVVGELRAGERELSDPARAIRIWLLDRACSFLHTSLDDVTNEVLPSVAGLLERRVEQVNELYAALDDA